jgi:predicted nuclease of restriction endonuclease-like (RecB) superfamily
MQLLGGKDLDKIQNTKAYKEFLVSIKERIRKAQYDALKQVNKELINLYWDIGKIIVEKQKELGWGKSVVENLAQDLQLEFSGIKGFSSQNLWRMRQFYLTYHNDIILSPLVRELGWSHNVVIVMNCKEKHERQFYIEMTKKQIIL